MRTGVALVLAGLLLAAPGPAAADDAPGAPVPSATRPPPAAAVVAAIAKAAIENAARPVESRVVGDALGDLYVRTAALAASDDVRAFTIGLAKALDPTDTLGTFSFTARSFRGLETPDEAKARLAAIGSPTLRGRNDRLLHFVLSAALTHLLGSSAAMMAGITKEVSDMKGPSGFSVGDLLADTAGVAFDERLATGDARRNLAWVAETFTGAAVVPEDAGLPDSLTQAEFEKQYGGISDARFVRMREKLVAAVELLPYLRPAEPSAAPGPASDPRRDPRPTR